MVKYLHPKIYVPSVYDIPYKYLKEKGKKGILFDIDNTLEPYDIEKPSEKVKDLLNYTLSLGYKITLISNNSEERVSLFTDCLPVSGLARANKPLPYKIEKTLKDMNVSKKDTLFIGDQIFTDILCANILGLFPILVKPLSDRDEWSVRPKRGLERIFVKEFIKESEKLSLEHFNK